VAQVLGIGVEALKVLLGFSFLKEWEMKLLSNKAKDSKLRAGRSRDKV
jgi:hypothetical protein